jgi:hypothetical protein
MQEKVCPLNCFHDCKDNCALFNQNEKECSLLVLTCKIKQLLIEED